MKTKIALMTTDGVGTTDLNVDTVKGVVTLHGKVATEAEKAKAARTAGLFSRTNTMLSVPMLFSMVAAGHLY